MQIQFKKNFLLGNYQNYSSDHTERKKTTQKEKSHGGVTSHNHKQQFEASIGVEYRFLQ